MLFLRAWKSGSVGGRDVAGAASPSPGRHTERPGSEVHSLEGLLAGSSPSSCPIPGTSRPISGFSTPQICGQHPFLPVPPPATIFPNFYGL